MPKDETEDAAFIANLVRRRCGNANVLRIDHFAHNAASAVCGTHKHGTEMKLLGGDPL
jgi:hypothetical protein